MAKAVFQFKVTLKDTDPLIWRRILVPETYNFWDLHVAIQDAMGWLDCHLHLFRIKRKHSRKFTEIGIPHEGLLEGEFDIVSGWEVRVCDFFSSVGFVADYDYDFGDGWRHEILLEGILLKEKGQKYPRCIGGARACPPEDCGGLGGFYQLLKIVEDPSHKEYEEYITWIGKKYDPDDFVPEKVKFDNPGRRWEIAFSEGI